MKKFFFLVFLFSFFFVDSTVAKATPAEIEIVFDASGSMNEPSGSTTKLTAAKEALVSLADEISSDAKVGFRIFGKTPISDYNQSCRDSLLVMPISPFNKDLMTSQVQNLTAHGSTPIGYSLQLAAQDFSTSPEIQKILILISDGAESCGMDPVAVIQGLQVRGFQVVIHTVGFAVDPEAEAQLQALAGMTGGSYHDVKDASQLTSELSKIVQESGLLLKPGRAESGENILAASAGARIVYASAQAFAELIDGREEQINDSFYPDDQVIFSFKDNRAVLLEKFTCPIFEVYPYNMRELELYGSDTTPNGDFFPLGVFKLQNLVSFENVYQEFKINPPRRVRYLKVVVGPGQDGAHSYGHEWKATGKILSE